MDFIQIKINGVLIALFVKFHYTSLELKNTFLHPFRIYKSTYRSVVLTLIYLAKSCERDIIIFKMFQYLTTNSADIQKILGSISNIIEDLRKSCYYGI